MSDTIEREKSPRQKLAELLETGTYNQVRTLMEILRPADIAALLRSSPPKEREIIWNLIPEDQQSEILQQVDEEIIGDLLSDKSAEEVATVLENIVSDDDLIDILQHLPDAMTRQILESMDANDRSRVENLLAYPEDTAGGMMDTDFISVRARVALDVVFRYLRRHPELPATTDSIFVVNSVNQYLGQLPLSRLLVSDPSLTVREMMSTEVGPIQVDAPESEVAAMFERYDLVSAPVVDEDGRLVGRITIDDVVDVIIDEANHSILGMAGMTEDDDLFAAILPTARRRAFWLGANLITAFIASAVINIFEETIAKVVALAVLMPIVASMGGVAGSQTLTLVIRTMAQGDLVDSNRRYLMNRELSVGAINGVFWALVVAAGAALAFGDPMLGMIIAAALVINMLTAALSGAVLPGLLKAINVDPAIAGMVVLTTITDVVGFMSFLGLATMFYA
jgi:magnesium transporter